MFSIPCLVLCLVAVSHQFSITTFEVPEAVEVGSDAELRCEHDAKAPPVYVKWWWTPLGGKEPRLLYQRIDSGHQIPTSHTEPTWNITLKSKESDNIVVWELQPAHSGTFICEVDEAVTLELRNASDLVVYSVGSGPVLNTTKFEDDQAVQVTCEAVGVAPEPDIILTIDSQTYNTTVRQNLTDGLFNVFTNATMLEEDLEGQEITCQLSFVESDLNIPSAVMAVSRVYHSDAWLATTTAEPDEVAVAPATLEAADQPAPGSSGRAGWSWLLLATLAASAHLALL